MSSIDLMIGNDLAALREESGRDLVGIDDALRTTNMYRDDRAGAEARRDVQADERRRELAMMPLTLAHVFAHRVARAAAGGTAIACTLLLLGMVLDPLLLRIGAHVVPGLDLAMLAALAAVAILGAYVLATWLAEGWFARQMRASIATSRDPYRDLDSLAQGPLDVARHAVRRVDGLSLALSLAGTCAVVLGFGYVTAVSSAVYPYRSAWTLSQLLQSDALHENIRVFVLALGVAFAFAFWLGRTCPRDEGRLRVLGRWPALVVAVLATAAAAYMYLLMRIELRYADVVPSTGARYALGMAATLSVVTAATWSLLRWRRRELSRIE